MTDAIKDRPMKRVKRAGRALAVRLLRLPAIIAKALWHYPFSG
jgi:hypothetical protein